jgi:hypothetical protein
MQNYLHQGYSRPRTKTNRTQGVRIRESRVDQPFAERTGGPGGGVSLWRPIANKETDYSDSPKCHLDPLQEE